MPDRIQLRRTIGWRKPQGAVVVARPSRWGNPYSVRAATEAGHLNPRLAAVDAYRAWLRGDPMEVAREGPPPSIEEIRRELRGRDLACWCPPDAPCHADVLLELANA